MRDTDKSKWQLISELEEMRCLVAQFRETEAEHKLAQVALQEHEEKLRRMFASVTDGIAVTDLNGIITEVNQSVLEIHRFSTRGDILGRSAFELIARPERERAMVNMRKTIEQGSIRNIEYTLLRANGSAFPGELSASVLNDAAGNSVGFIAITRDITNRKRVAQALRESQEKYRSLIDDVLDSSAVGIFILDSAFRIVWLNQALERYFGLCGCEIIGKDIRWLVNQRIKDIFEEPESFVNKILATYDNNEHTGCFECHVLPDGEREERWLEHWSQPIQSGLYSGGRIEHYTDRLRPVTGGNSI